MHMKKAHHEDRVDVDGCWWELSSQEMGIPSGNQTWLAGKSSVCIENGKGFNGKIGYKWWIFHLLSTKMECFFFVWLILFPVWFFSWISVSLFFSFSAFLLVCFSRISVFSASLLFAFLLFPASLPLCFSAILVFLLLKPNQSLRCKYPRKMRCSNSEMLQNAVEMAVSSSKMSQIARETDRTGDPKKHGKKKTIPDPTTFMEFNHLTTTGWKIMFL